MIKKQFGFTIIELIVVIAIIAVLSAIVITNVNKYQAKARDARRRADIENMKKALELYYADNGSYPTLNWGYSDGTGTWSFLQSALQPYLSKLPVDPINNTGPAYQGALNYGYYSGITHKTTPGCDFYMLVFNGEVTDFPNPGVYNCKLPPVFFDYSAQNKLPLNVTTGMRHPAK